MMLPVPVPDYMQPKITYDSNRVIELLVVLSVVFLLMSYQNRLKNNVTSKVQISDSDLKSSPSKKKRVRKSGKNNIIVEENIRIHKEAVNEARN